MTTTTERPGTSTVEVAGRTVRVASLRPAHPAGEPIVLLHGLGGYLEEWTETQQALAQHHAVHALDLPGFGRSQPLDHPTLPAIARHLLATLDELGITEPIHLAGNSLGGAIAMQVAVEAPDRVATLVLANSAGFGKQVTIGLRLLGVPLLGRLLLRERSARQVRMNMKNRFYDPAFATEERVALETEFARREGAVASFTAVARTMGTWRGVRPGWRHRLLQSLSKLRIPTLIVWGTHDRILPPAQIIAAARALPHARTHLFPETGHMPQIERTEEFTALVREFVATNRRPSTSEYHE